jgi:hypothetical protein
LPCCGCWHHIRCSAKPWESLSKLLSCHASESCELLTTGRRTGSGRTESCELCAGWHTGNTTSSGAESRKLCSAWHTWNIVWHSPGAWEHLTGSGPT